MPSQETLDNLKKARISLDNAFGPSPAAPGLELPSPSTDSEDPVADKARAIRMLELKQKLDAMHEAEDAAVAQNGPTLSANPQAAALAAQVPVVMTSDQQPSSDSGTFQGDIDKVKRRAYLAKLAAGGQ